jgi:hypothetical protein
MPLAVLNDIRRIYEGLNAEGIRRAAHQDLNVGLMAITEDGYEQMERFLAPLWLEAGSRSETLRMIHRVNGTPGNRFDFILCAEEVPVPSDGYRFDPSAAEMTAKAIVGDHQPLELTIARNFPLFRHIVADHVIHRISRENALFSLVTALPNIIPNIIELPWAVGEFATDTAFLTMNQIRMALMMAAMHGCPVGYAEQKAQIAAIAASAFGWRALARELVGKIPLGGGLIPKAAVAFAGTYVVGLGLEKISRTGSGLSKREKQDAYAEAFAKGKKLATELAPSTVKVA